MAGVCRASLYILKMVLGVTLPPKQRLFYWNRVKGCDLATVAFDVP